MDNNLIIFIIVGIMAAQLVAVFRVVVYIKQYRALIPDVTKKLSIKLFNPVELKNLDPVRLSAHIDQKPTDSSTGLPLLVWSAKEKAPHIFISLLKAINGYLYANRKGVSDYNLILEMVERRVVKYEEQIELLMPIPVYLGLIGTMVGIILGLGDLDFGETGLLALMSEVMYAMVASGFGLLLTVIVSGLVYRLAKSSIINTKGVFLDFLQSRLVPMSGTGVSNSLVKLQSQMVGFNDSFAENITAMSKVMDKVYENLETESGLVQQMQDFDFGTVSENVVQMGEANARAFESMGHSIEQIEEFKELMGLINQFLEMSQTVVSTGDRVYGRLSGMDVNLEAVADEIKDRLDQNAQLQQFLTNQFLEADNYESAFNNTVSRVGNTLRKSLDALEDQTKASLESIIQIQGTERQALSKAMADNRLSLGNLSRLDDIHEELKEFTNQLISLTINLQKHSQPHIQENSANKSDMLMEAIKINNKQMQELVEELRKEKSSSNSKKGNLKQNQDVKTPKKKSSILLRVSKLIEQSSNKVRRRANKK